MGVPRQYHIHVVELKRSFEARNGPRKLVLLAKKEGRVAPVKDFRPTRQEKERKSMSMRSSPKEGTKLLMGGPHTASKVP